MLFEELFAENLQLSEKFHELSDVFEIHLPEQRCPDNLNHGAQIFRFFVSEGSHPIIYFYHELVEVP